MANSEENHMSWITQFPDTPQKPNSNIFEISSFPHWETVSSNVWAYFLNPDEKHNFKDLFLKSILELIQSKSSSNDTGALSNLRVDSVIRERQTINVSESDKKRIDIEVLGNFGVLVIENKIDADDSNNPMEAYETQAQEDYKSYYGDDTNINVYACYLSQHRITKETRQKWTKHFNETTTHFALLRYDAVFDKIMDSLHHYAFTQFNPRSWDLFLQFVENTSVRKGRGTMAQDITEINDTISLRQIL